MAQYVIYAAAARITDPAPVDQSDPNLKSLAVIINVTAVTSTPSVTPHIQGKDPASGAYYDVLVGVPITATGVTVLKIGPGIGQIPNAAAADYMPDGWRLTMVHGNANSITYSAAAVTGE